jgi:preprotein translocase subunit SecD
VIADLVLLTNVILIVAFLGLFGAALTLPGIAGIVLTVGTAVDANILIYERIREEIKVGASPWAAINAGFDKAFSAIADSNVTMFMAGGVLFLFGSGPVRGFAVTLIIGLVASMFTSIVVTRAIMDFFTRRDTARLSV